jgi:hypothetical protein
MNPFRRVTMCNLHIPYSKAKCAKCTITPASLEGCGEGGTGFRSHNAPLPLIPQPTDER